MAGITCGFSCAGARAWQVISELSISNLQIISSPMWCIMVYRCAKRRTCSCAGARVWQVSHGILVALVRMCGRYHIQFKLSWCACVAGINENGYISNNII